MTRATTVETVEIDLVELPLRDGEPDGYDRSMRVITIRMSGDLHEALNAEAGRVGLSANRLCKLKIAAAMRASVPREWLRHRRAAIEGAEMAAAERAKGVNYGGAFNHGDTENQ